MTETSYIDISAFTPKIYADILSVLPEERRKKAEGYSFLNGKYLSAAAGYLLTSAMERRGINPDGANIIAGKNGKPYIEGNPFYFSLSHSGNIAVCAVSDGEVGADIERVASIRESVIKGAYTPNEKLLLQGIEGDKKAEAFFRIWTAKESVIKYIGAGLLFPLKNIDISFKPFISADIVGVKEKLFFKEYYIEGYKTAVCASSNDFSESIKKISLPRL